MMLGKRMLENTGERGSSRVSMVYVSLFTGSNVTRCLPRRYRWPLVYSANLLPLRRSFIASFRFRSSLAVKTRWLTLRRCGSDFETPRRKLEGTKQDK